MSTTDARGSGDDDDAFAVLGVSRDCTISELKQVYRLLARRYHPDVNPRPDAAAQMCRINLAFDRALEQIEMPVHAAVEAKQKPAPPATHANTHVATHQAPTRTPPSSQQQRRPRGTDRATRVNARAAVRAVGLARRLGSLVASPRVRERAGVGRRATACIGIAALVVLAVLAAIHVLAVPSSAVSRTPAAKSLGLRLGATTTMSWQDTGSVTLSERLLAQLAPGQHLNEAPQWSFDGVYVALSVAAVGGGGSSATASAGAGAPPANVVVLENGRQLTTLPGTSSRWSPSTDQLAVLTRPGSTGTHQLELVSPAAGDGKPPMVLDPAAGTHLAWSNDGSQIAYSANAQQQIRLASVAQPSPDGSPEALLNASPGQHLTPIGWQSDQVVSILHDGTSFSLVAVDLAGHRTTALGDLESLPSGPAAVMTRDGVVFVAKTSNVALTTLAWYGSQQQWHVQLVGIQTVRFLAGWSFDGTWLALAPAPSGVGTSLICLAHVPTAEAQPPARWTVHCLPITGTLLGLSWEPHADTLSYVRTPHPGGALELRELHIKQTLAGVAPAALATGTTPQSVPLGLMGVVLVGLRRRVRSRRFFAARRASGPDHTPVPYGVAPPTHDDSTATAGARLRVAIISEILRWPPDEGLKRMALALVQCLSRHAAVLAIGTRAQRVGGQPYPVVTIPTNRSFIQPRLWMQLRRFRPSIVCYIPGSGLTTFSLLRALALRLGMHLLGRRSALALVSVQPRAHGRFHTCLFWLLRPVMVIVQSELRTRELRALGCRARSFTGAVDVEVFRPVSAEDRLRLRQEWNIAPESFVVLHVGHLKATRNLGMLAALQRSVPDLAVMVVASTSTRQDTVVEQPLEQEGVRVIKTYVQHIENLYQLADCYVFPVQETCGSAELPLSVLEALACGLPVATTHFGALVELLPPGPLVRYFSTLDELTACIRDFQTCRPAPQAARALAMPYGWDRAALDLLDQLAILLGTSPAAAVRAQTQPCKRPGGLRNR